MILKIYYYIIIKVKGDFMSLRFVIGKCGTGKSFFCLEEIAKKQKMSEKSKLIYTVPEQNTLSAEKELISHTENKCIMNAKVLSFKRLAYRVFSELGYSGKNILSEAGRYMAIRKIAYENKENLEFFASALGKEGVLDRLDYSIGELFKSKVSPDDLDKIIEKIDGDSLSCIKLKDLKTIFSGYMDFLNSGYSSSEEALDILAEKISNSDIIKDSEIWIDGFYSFTAQELKIIEGMLLCAKRVTVVLNIEKETFLKRNLDMSHIFYEPWLTADILFKMAGRLNVETEATVFMEKSFKYASFGMKWLQDNLSKAIYSSAENSKGVYIFAASDKYAEAEDTAEKINELVRMGFRYKDIGVLSREVEDYSRIISGVFQEYDIPVFIDKLDDIRENAFIKLILNMLDAVCSNFSYEDVFSYIKTGLSPLNDEEADILENYVLKYGIKGKKYFESWDFGFSDNDPKKEFINSAREKIAVPFLEFSKKINYKKSYPLNTIADALLDFISDTEAYEKTMAAAESFFEAGDKRGADKLKRSFEVMINLMEDAKSILGKEVLSLKEFSGVLEAGLSKCDLGLVPYGNDMVVVGDLERTRLNNIKVLFVLGMNEGIIPKAPQSMGIFSDYENEIFENFGADFIKSGKRVSFEENYLIYIGLSQPSHFLRLSYCISDSKGSGLRPSVIINKIKKIFPNLKEDCADKYKDRISLAEPSIHKLASRISQGENLSPLWEGVLNFALSDTKHKEKVQNMLRASSDSALEKKLIPKNIKKLYGGKLNLSATSVNLYAGCPFSYFVRYGLKAKERAVYEIKNPDLGSIFHSVLKRFSDELAFNKIYWADISKEEMDYRIEKAVDDIAPVFSEKILLSKAGYRYLIKRIKKISKKALWALSKHIEKGAFSPLGFEVGFGKNESLPPVCFKLDSGDELILCGKIDRVDVFRKDGDSYIKIIDYKISGKTFDLMSVYYGIELQLMLYMAAFIDSGEAILPKEIIPGGVFYFGIKGQMISEDKNKVLSSDEIASALLKNFKMNGLLIDDKDIVNAMDSELKSSSDIIPVRIKKSGELYSSSSAVKKEDFNEVLSYSKNKFKEIGEEIFSGKISPSPYKIKKNTACSYCGYKSICRFDSAKKTDNYRILKELKDKEIMELIKNKTKA